MRDGCPGTEEDRVVVLRRSILRSRVRHWRAARNAIEERFRPRLRAVDRTDSCNCKPSSVLINVGHGPIVDEGALVEALTNGTIRSAGLDVTTVEPLPRKCPLWKLDNVLLSPHNMDMTRTFMRESTEFFVNENLPRFVRGKTLLNPVDKSVRYSTWRRHFLSEWTDVRGIPEHDKFQQI